MAKKEKAGFNVKMDNEKIIYIIILILITIFMFNMKNIYNFFESVRTGQFLKQFKKEPVEEPKENEPKKEEEKNKDTYTVVVPVGASKTSCQYLSSEAAGNKTTKVNLHFTGTELKSIEEVVSYTASTEDYTNFIYSEKGNYDKRKANNINLAGYSIVMEMTGTGSLKVSSVFDLSKVSITDVKTDTDDTMVLFGSNNADITAVKGEYTRVGYTCER